MSLIHYSICPANPQAHLFEVCCTVETPLPEGQCFSLPNWIPGSYMIRDFSRHVVSLSAFCEIQGERQPVAVAKLDKNTWRCEPVEGPLQVVYQVYAWDLSVRGAHLDQSHGYFNGTSVFLAAMGFEDQSCTLEIFEPTGIDGWKVATSMPLGKDTERYGFGQYQAENYDELIDHPVEMGTFELATFFGCGVQHDIVFTGKQRADIGRICEDLTAICEQHILFFGEPPPLDYYLFQVMVVGNGYGGLEHRASTSLVCSRADLPTKSNQAPVKSEGYKTFLGLCSHEYFHTWNVKRIKPAAFTPFDLSQEVYTELLWAFEGITSYYDDLALLRSGCINEKEYLALLAQTATRVYRGEGRHLQTVTESSFDTWTRFYQQDENAANAIVSYYAKGALIALALDLTLRSESNGKHSLDHVMQILWQRHGKTGVGVPEQGLQAIAEEVIGKSLSGFFDQVLYSTDELPLTELLADYGVNFELRPQQSNTDKGGTKKVLPKPWLGIRHEPHALGAKLAMTHQQGAANQAGLAAGDVIIAIDHLKVSSAGLDKLLSTYDLGDVIIVHAFRRDELFEVELSLSASPSNTAQLSFVNSEANSKALKWLRG